MPSSFEVMEGYKYAFYDDAKIPKSRVKRLAKNLQKPNAKYAFISANDALIPDDIDEVIKAYPALNIPTLILWGREDVVIRSNKAYKLHNDIQNSRLHFIESCGHMPQEEKPQETLKEIRKFLAF